MSLHGAIDDATGKVLGIYFRMEEDTIGYMQMLTHLDGSIGALYQDKPYSLEACCRQPRVSEKQVPVAQEQAKSAKPAKDNPWRNFKFGKARYLRNATVPTG